MALAEIGDAGEYGLTADELAARLNMDRYSIQPRTSELKHKGLIIDSGLRRPNETGKLAIVWIAK
jgi:predicted transcriptional regulator